MHLNLISDFFDQEQFQKYQESHQKYHRNNKKRIKKKKWKQQQ